MDQNQNNNTKTMKRTIQPLNEDKVKAYITQNNTAQTVSRAQVPVTSSPAPSQTPGTLDAEEVWKPNTPLAKRIPALRNYGIALIVGSIFFMYLNRSIWKFSDQSAKNLGIVIYVVLGVMLLSGIIILLSKSKAFVQICLNVVIGLSVLIGILSLLSLNIIAIVFTLIIIGSVLNIKQYVKRAA